MILVDTSVWVDFFRGRESPEVAHLSHAIAAHEDLCVCGLVLTEILQGIDSERQYATAKQFISALIYLPLSRDGYCLAADIYRIARATGRTIRNTVDCVIAACAIENNAELLQRDKDFLVIADVSRLRLVGPL